MSDNFSVQAAAYASFRPRYPSELARQIASLTTGHQLVWDCATGNGQMAQSLADYFQRVIATDLSHQQLSLAVQKKSIEYRCEVAYQSSLMDQSADAVVVAQAIHWFNFDDFYAEVRRVLRPGGLIAVVGYPLPEISDPTLNNAFLHFYAITLNGYWQTERKYLDEEYTTIPFPFEELPYEPISMKYDWDMEALMGYLHSWSAVQNYIKKNNHNPVDCFLVELETAWPKNQKKVRVTFPIVGRFGRV